MFEILELKEKNAILKAKGIEIKARIKYQAQDFGKEWEGILEKINALYTSIGNTIYFEKIDACIRMLDANGIKVEDLKVEYDDYFLYRNVKIVRNWARNFPVEVKTKNLFLKRTRGDLMNFERRILKNFKTGLEVKRTPQEIYINLENPEFAEFENLKGNFRFVTDRTGKYGNYTPEQLAEKTLEILEMLKKSGNEISKFQMRIKPRNSALSYLGFINKNEERFGINDEGINFNSPDIRFQCENQVLKISWNSDFSKTDLKEIIDAIKNIDNKDFSTLDNINSIIEKNLKTEKFAVSFVNKNDSSKNFKIGF